MSTTDADARREANNACSRAYRRTKRGFLMRKRWYARWLLARAETPERRAALEAGIMTLERALGMRE